MTLDKFSVAFPQAGEAAFVRFLMKDMKALSAEGIAFAAAVERLEGMDLDVIDKTLSLALNGAVASEVLEMLPISVIAAKLLDALFLRSYGRDVAGQLQHLADERARFVVSALAAPAAQ